MGDKIIGGQGIYSKASTCVQALLRGVAGSRVRFVKESRGRQSEQGRGSWLLGTERALGLRKI